VIRRKGGIKRGINAANEAAFHPEAERGIDTLRGDAGRGWQDPPLHTAARYGAEATA